MSNAQKTLTEIGKEKTVKLADKTYIIRPFYVRQFCKISILMKDLIPSAIKPEEKNSVIFNILSSADKRFPELISLVVGEAFAEADADRVTIKQLSELTLAICEVNDVEGIYKNFIQAIRKITAQVPDSKTK